MKGGTANGKPGTLAEPLASTPVAAPLAPPPVVPASAATPVVTPTPTVPSAVVTPASSVRLDVVSDPAGATVLKNGFQVCDQTPCEVVAAQNETLELEARKGALKGTAKVLAQRDQRVTIKLIGAPKASGASAPKMCEVEVDGLKILRPCQ